MLFPPAPRGDVPSGDKPNQCLARVFLALSAVVFPPLFYPSAYALTKSFFGRKIEKGFALVQGLSCRNIESPSALVHGCSRSADSIPPFLLGNNSITGCWEGYEGQRFREPASWPRAEDAPSAKTLLGLDRGNLATKYS